jgi:anti-sigma regulatory factor (Ser/Thr protein kinase)
MEIDLLRQSLAITIRETHDVGDARRQATQAARDMAFDETAAGKVGIVVTELAGNLVKHAGGGTLILRGLSANDPCGLEFLTLDDGPGMDVQRCMEDGYSTAGSPGTGLGAIKRLAHSFEIYSLRDRGTVSVATLWRGKPPVAAYDIGAVCLPVAGELLCGDGWAVKASPTGLDFVVSDGLGHGPIAAQATDMALDTFARGENLDPGMMLARMHGDLRSTRGAAVLTGHINAVENTLTCAGLGNIAGYVMAQPKPRGVVSMNGIVGHQLLRAKTFTYDCAANDLVILHSDGLTTHWKLDDFPGLTTRSASLIAGMMYKHFRRGKDDATVLVIRRH